MLNFVWFIVWACVVLPLYFSKAEESSNISKRILAKLSEVGILFWFASTVWYLPHLSLSFKTITILMGIIFLAMYGIFLARKVVH